MEPWTTFDYPSFSSSTRSNRRGSTRPSTGSTRPHTLFGGPPSYHRGRRGGGPHRPRGGGSRGGWGYGNRGDGGGGSHYNDYNNHNNNNNIINELCEKFDELEAIEDINEVVKDVNLNKFNVNSSSNDNDDKSNDKVINFDAYEDIPVEVSGENVPKKVSTFGEIDLGKALNENIKRCKYVKPTPIQCHALPIAMEGRDLMACAQTGSGKTAAFCFPIIAGILKKVPPYRPPLNRGGGGGGSGGYGGGYGGGSRMICPVALIMSPTRELSSQIHDEAQKFAYQTGVKVAVAYGGTPMVEQLRKLAKGVDILVATPGRLVDMIERGKISLRMVRYLTLDEADRMLDMGFEPQIRKIVQQMDMPPPGSRQTMLFSATFPTEIQKLASDFLSDYIFLTVGKVGSSTDLIEQKVEFVDDYDKKKALKDILLSQKTNGNNGKHALTIIFAETKRGVDDLTQWLSDYGFPATAIHGAKVQWERERALRSFKSGITPIMVATDVAARGLDIPSVAHVINFDLPRDIDNYVHRIGRTGRAGKAGLATAFFNEKNQPISKALVELMEDSHQNVPSWLIEYAETPTSYGYRGNSRRSRGGNFGGHDYRSFNQGSSGGGYSNYSNDFSGPTESYNNDSYTSSGYDFTHNQGYDSIEASGWE